MEEDPFKMNELCPKAHRLSVDDVFHFPETQWRPEEVDGAALSLCLGHAS